jgi:hypothetical protein
MSACGEDPSSDFLTALRVLLFTSWVCGLVGLLVAMMLN